MLDEVGITDEAVVGVAAAVDVGGVVFPADGIDLNCPRLLKCK